jgi:hypothetical protein
MAAKKPTTSERLDTARADLQTIEQQIDDIDTQRATALLTDNDREATTLGLRLDEARQVARTITDKCALLEIEVEKEKIAAEARRREQHVKEFADTLEQADVAGDELQATVAVLEEIFRKVIELRERAFSMWPHGRSSHGDAAARAVEGAAMAGPAIAVMLANELHRVGSEAMLGGRPGEQVKVRLPGGQPERLTPQVDRKTGQLIPPTPLAERLRNASRFAVETLRGDLFIPAATPQPPAPQGFAFNETPPQPQQEPPRQQAHPPAPVQPQAPAAGDVVGLKEYVPPQFRAQLAVLHTRQAQLARGNDDLAYEQCLADLVALRAAIEEAKQAENTA